MHPLVQDLSSLKTNELETKISELTKKYFMTYNPGVQAQISAVLEHYQTELSNRHAEDWKKATESRDKSLDKLINVS